jgi:hypothetical protein
MRAMYLANYFVAGCIASSFLGWVASLHPMAFRAVLCLLAAIAIGWVLGVAQLGDDSRGQGHGLVF